MNFETIEAVANAVLFEGYMLYPYRQSALKNRRRWNFGTLYPRAFAEAQNPQERYCFSAQIIVEASERTRLSASLRFLQLLSPVGEDDESWANGFARSRSLEGLSIVDLVNGIECKFDVSDLSPYERSQAPACFRSQPRVARLVIQARQLGVALYQLNLTLHNESPTPVPLASRTMAQDVAFTSAHLLLGVMNGHFVSLLDPPPQFQAAVGNCEQNGVFPVLVGREGERTRVLCSPIILYDYPQLAPESAGDYYDSTEIDEMLALRVLTLTEEEKRQIRAGDPHARAILERTEQLPPERMLGTHGTLRGLRAANEMQAHELSALALEAPSAFGSSFPNPFEDRPRLESIRISGVELRRGDRVRLRPQKQADILDMTIEGRVAIIEAIEQDLEDNVQLAVVLEDDPGRDLGMLRQTGHRFFYAPHEVEPLQIAESRLRSEAM